MKICPIAWKLTKWVQILKKPVTKLTNVFKILPYPVTSVTRWLNNLFNFGPLTACKCCQSDEISPNLVTLQVILLLPLVQTLLSLFQLTTASMFHQQGLTTASTNPMDIISSGSGSIHSSQGSTSLLFLLLVLAQVRPGPYVRCQHGGTNSA